MNYEGLKQKFDLVKSKQSYEQYVTLSHFQYFTSLHLRVGT